MLKLILDEDTGIDDAIALTIAARDKDIELLGVTCTYGNVTVDESVRNTLDMLSVLKRDDVKVYRGRDRALSSSSPYSPHEAGRRIHGPKGTGDIVLPKSRQKEEVMDGVEYLKTMMESRSDFTLVTTGPLTNLASVLLEEPQLSSWKGKVVSMIGAFERRGNVNEFAEANSFKDPEAAKIVFESDLDITMIGLDVTEKTRLYKRNADEWRESGSEEGRILSSLLSYYIDNTLGGDETYVHDPSAVIYALHSSYFTTIPTPITVVTEGRERGRTIKGRKENARSSVAIEVERDKVEAFLSNIKNYF